MARHDELHDGIFDLVVKSFTPVYVCDDYNIFIFHDVPMGEGQRQREDEGKFGTAAGGEGGEVLPSDL